jgi:tetratricopeptide (TPR) repeat protein
LKGKISQSLGEIKDAINSYSDCLEIQTKIFGPDSIDVAKTLNSIGIAYKDQGDYSKAFENYKKCLEIRTKILGSDSIEVGKTLNNIGIVC